MLTNKLEVPYQIHELKTLNSFLPGTYPEFFYEVKVRSLMLVSFLLTFGQQSAVDQHGQHIHNGQEQFAVNEKKKTSQ